MNNIDLLSSVSKDLKILTYESEPVYQYRGRIIYSAISLLMLACTFDSESPFDKDTIGVSKRYLYNKSSNLLNEYLLLYSDAKQWFYPNSKCNPIEIIRTRLLQSGNLINVGFSTNVATQEPYLNQMIDGISRLYGYPLDFANGKMSGLTWIVKDNNVVEINNNENIINFTNNYLNSLRYTEKNVIEGYEFFNPHKQSSNMYNCWEDKPSLISEKYTLLREKVYDYTYNYNYYIKKEHNSSTFIYRIDELSVHERIPTKIMYGLRAIYKNPIKAYYEFHGDYIMIHLKAKLPLSEEISLYTLGWPCKSIDDEFCWLFTSDIWPYIKTILEGLNIIMEEYYG
ncbi:hypothetical protein CM240_2938 [Clostridium bornimense]|uniref:Uncharacterized protein n=1 Tax=Clostridium bornimense TaxID=1216932 RepID=W6SJY6_9CLOT|nr:hypothetical protein [Clostridium bornimense]CDM70055.1 hypothetical protein CM240_2938 [Clostridium bornimense]